MSTTFERIGFIDLVETHDTDRATNSPRCNHREFPGAVSGRHLESRSEKRL